MNNEIEYGKSLFLFKLIKWISVIGRISGLSLERLRLSPRLEDSPESVGEEVWREDGCNKQEAKENNCIPIESLSNPEKLRMQGSGIYSPIMEFPMGGERKAHPLLPPQCLLKQNGRGGGDGQEAQSSSGAVADAAREPTVGTVGETVGPRRAIPYEKPAGRDWGFL